MQESTGERQLTDVFTQATPEQLDRVMADAADLANFIFSVSGDGKERLKLADAIRLLLVIQEEEFASGRGVTSPQGLGRGHLAPDGGPPLWGEAPCLSTYDLQRVGRFDTTAHTLLMVENAAPLAVLARDGWGHQGYLVAYLAGMPKLAFFDFLPKLRGPGLAASLLWVDWDVGGLRILRNLLGRWPSHLPPLRVVPHPASILPHLTFSASVPSLRPAPALRPIEVPPSYLNSGDPQVASFAATLQRYGALYQEEVLSMYRQLLSLPP